MTAPEEKFSGFFHCTERHSCICLVIYVSPAAAFPLLQEAPVWEITGAEFSKSEMHTADGISIRFPRMTRIRDDKDWKSATNLHQLKVGYQQFDSSSPATL